MELQTISEVSVKYGVSSRMLSYYEQRGLIKSRRMEGYSYRVYDEPAIKRLQQVIILRKLQIPVKQIRIVLNNPAAAAIIEIFKKNIRELDSEITALSTIRKILSNFVSELEKTADLNLNHDFLNGDSVMELTGSLSLIQKNVKRGSMTMNDLSQASEVLNKLHNVRVICLPPMTVASYRHTGENAEENAVKTADDFVRKSGLLKIKPDIRHFIFEHPDRHPEDDILSYEALVSVPDDMDVPAPLVKKKMRGGMYAAYTIDIDTFESWLGMQDWINDSDKYQFDNDLTRIALGEGIIYIFNGRNFFEEQLNYYHNIQNPDFNPDDLQRDLLMPIKPAEITPEISADITDSLERCGFKARLVNRNKFKIMGFAKYMPYSGSKKDPMEAFTDDIKSDGRLDILHQFRKPGAPILGYGYVDLDAQRNGGWRWTYGLLESDITDAEAFLKHNPYIKKFDASKWLCFEYAREDNYHAIKMKAYGAAFKLGYTHNGVMGFIDEYPDGSIGKPVNEADKKSVLLHWFPVL